MKKKKLSKRMRARILELVVSDTYTHAEICSAVGISPRTFYYWRKEMPDFDQDIKDAEDARMQDLVRAAKHSLRRKIEGYTVDETKVISVPGKEKDANGKPKAVIKEQHTNHRHIAPDTAAIIFALTNGDPDNWRNRQTNEIVGKDGKDLFKDIPDDELDKRIAELEKKLNTQ